MTIAYGQNAANGMAFCAFPGPVLIGFEGELGLGPDEPKSATKPTRHQPLAGIEILRSVILPQMKANSLMSDVSAWRLASIPRYSLQSLTRNFLIFLGILKSMHQNFVSFATKITETMTLR